MEELFFFLGKGNWNWCRVLLRQGSGEANCFRYGHELSLVCASSCWEVSPLGKQRPKRAGGLYFDRRREKDWGRKEKKRRRRRLDIGLYTRR